jgi:hypothetical protein
VKSKFVQFPLIAQAARDILIIPGFKINIERLFCRGKDLLSIQQYALGNKNIRLLTLLKLYFKRKLNTRKVIFLEVSISLYLLNKDAVLSALIAPYSIPATLKDL